MTRIEDILSRALLARDRTVPRDIVPTTCPAAHRPRTAPAVRASTAQDSDAAEDLRALCETLVSHTPATDVADFVTEQVPQPRSALALACVLQLTDTDDGARFWWQYAAGAGQPAAAYCLYLHHLAQGEDAAADWWHRQTDDVEPVPDSPAAAEAGTPDPDRRHSTSTTTILRILRHLSRHTVRPRTMAVTHLMAYMPTAVTIGYLREPDMDLPLPGPDFAHRVGELLTAAGRPDVSDTLPGRKPRDARSMQEAVSR
ncbi:hypothetical protein [Streptomyces sp. SGAir0957]